MPLSNHDRDCIRALLSRYGVTHARIFGSVARGTDGPESDLDLLVDLPKDASLWEVIALKLAIEDTTGIRVDLVEERCLPPAIAEQALREATAL